MTFTVMSMTRYEFQTRFASGVHLLDGATGSNLLKAGMPRNVCAEQWVLEHPDTILRLQTAYLDAGSEILYAPSFGANRVLLERHGLSDRVRSLNRGLAALCKNAFAGRCFVAGDITTTGQPIDPDNPEDYAELVEIYKEQAEALGEGGADLFVVETMMGVSECMAAVEAIRTLCDLPILCSLSVQADGKCYFDGCAQEAAEALTACGADAVGVNCSGGPVELESVVRCVHAATPLPVIAKPNAGLPIINDRGEAVYPMDAATFAEKMKPLIAAGATFVGGCCGTDPAYIAALKGIIQI